MDDKQKLTGDQILAEGLDDWRLLLHAIHARFATGDFAAGVALANRISEAAEEMNHHPDLDLRYPHLNVKLTSHDVGAVTQRDVRLARQISEFAAEAGVQAEPSAVSELELALDTPDHARVKPFWQAVLGMSDNPAVADELTDQGGALPNVWFQGTDPHETPRQRFHLDIHVPHDVAKTRIAAALEAGGTLVSDSAAPSYVVLADADGNKACVCTWQATEPSEERASD